MSKRADCPVCGATCNANTLKRDGCWSCQQNDEQEKLNEEFHEFMELIEEERWRYLFEKTR